jgi:S-formylglutathione hydrolase FrmB
MVVFRAPGFRTTYLNGEQAGDVEDLIVGDLVDQLQKKYRLQTEREHRALMGVSMGGMGALKIAMHHPEVFGAVAVHSAAILPADPAELPQRYQMQVNMVMQRGGLGEKFGDPIDKAKWAHEMPLGLVAACKPDDWKGLRFYFDAGTKDNYGFCEPNEQLDKAMTEKGIPHLFRKVEGGGHAWSSPKMKECVQSSLQFVGACVTGKDPMPKGPAAGDAAKKPADAAQPKETPKEAPKEPAKQAQGAGR